MDWWNEWLGGFEVLCQLQGSGVLDPIERDHMRTKRRPNTNRLARR
uniref:Uncharacterized protein n=1 Tax=Setaria italica TaxID=4555 RepID=K3ZPH3_SETIT